MKKQRQNISSTVSGDNTLNTLNQINNNLNNTGNSINSANSSLNTGFIANKRDREAEISGEFSIDLSVDENFANKKQKTEEHGINSLNLLNPLNNLNPLNSSGVGGVIDLNESLMNNTNTSLNSANNNYNIINNSHTGNINVNINNYMSSLQSGNCNIRNNLLDFPGNNNFRQGIGMTQPMPNVTPTYNLYQNLAGHNKVGGQFAYSSYYGGANNMGNNMGNLNVNPTGMGNVYTSRFSSPGNIGNIGHGAKFTQNYNNFNQQMYCNVNTTGNIASNSLNANVNANVSATEKKKYIIKELPEMTVGNYLQNKNVQDMYMKSIKKDDESENAGMNANIKRNLNIDSVNTESVNKSIVLESKTVQAQLNTANVNANIINQPIISQTSSGNVITFNKTKTNNAPANTFQQQGEVNININNNNNNNNNKFTTNNPTANANITKPGDFSEKLQKYIQRAYEKCKDDFDRLKCQKALLKIISAALSKKDINTRDWDNYPLPVLPSLMRDEIKPVKTVVTDMELKNREKRKGRFDLVNVKGNAMGVVNSPFVTKNPNNNGNISIEDNPNSNQAIIIGTCQTLEKQYLRLTTIPDPSQVRPENVLKKSLQMLKDKWKKKEADYNYVSEQFRSIRQDMTIQHIQNEFTVRVYETHARIALESLDLDQFNQCQTALVFLYQKGFNCVQTKIKSNSNCNQSSSSSPSSIEFLAYRIMYTILQGIKYDMENLLRDVHQLEKKSGIISKNYEISHALKFTKALNSHNYFECFKLYKIAPNMGSYLIEPFMSKLRIKALLVIALGYVTEANIAPLAAKFAFDSVELFVKFLEENGITLSKDKKKIMCKESMAALNGSKFLNMHVKASLL